MMKHIDVQAPYDRQLISTLEMHTEKEAMDMLAEAHGLFQDKSRWLPVHHRIAIFERAVNLIGERKMELAQQAAHEGGKPLMDSLVEIERGMEGLKIAVRELGTWGGREIPMGLTKSSEKRMAYTRRVPKGVVFAISAFNHPFNLIVHQVVPALAVGCPVLVKPSFATPFSCKNFIDILHEAGLPPRWCRMLLCDHAMAEKIVSDARTSFLTFIGSAKVGWYLRSKLAPGATCALEHGGAAPVIVDETADLAAAIPAIIKGGFYHAGQVCVSVQRVFLHAQIADKFLEQFVPAVKKLIVGDPLQEKTEVGPLIRPQEVDRVHQWVEKSQGKILCGGKKISDTCYEPTVVLEPSESSDLSTQEVFGPVVCVYKYTDLKDAIKRANNVEYAFQSAIYTQNIQAMQEAVENLEALAVMVNEHTAFRVDWMPFGGYKTSGLGVGGIGPTMHEMSREKMFLIK